MRAAVRNTHWRAIATLFVAFALVLAACGDDDAGSGTVATTAAPTTTTVPPVNDIVVATELNVNNMDGLNTGSVVFTKAIYTYLVQVDPAGIITGDVASSWSANADATEWTFEIRDDILFSDGTPLTADDVVFSYQTVMANEESTQRTYVRVIDTIEKVGDNSVKITVTAPNSAFLNSSASYLAIVPAASYDPELFKTSPIGAGPYRVVNFNGTDTVQLTANTNYYKGTPSIQNVTVQNIGDQTTRLVGLQSGQIDVAMLDGNNVRIAESAGLVVDSVPSSRVTYLGYNLRSPKLASPQLREAISFAIDRNAMVQTLLQGLGDPIFQLVTPTVVGYDASIPVPQQDIQRARDLIAASGYNGEEILFEYPASAYVPVPDQVAQAVQAYLVEVGLNVKLEAVANSTFLTNWLNKELKEMWLFSATTVSLDGGRTFAFMINNIRTFEDDALVALQATQDGETDPAVRLGMLGDISRTINENSYYTPMFAQTWNFVHSPDVDLVGPPAHGYTYPHLVVPAP